MLSGSRAHDVRGPCHLYRGHVKGRRGSPQLRSVPAGGRRGGLRPQTSLNVRKWRGLGAGRAAAGRRLGRIKNRPVKKCVCCSFGKTGLPPLSGTLAGLPDGGGGRVRAHYNVRVHQLCVRACARRRARGR
jgi:hypothetical protein